MDMASIVNQDGKNKGMHMMGQTVLLELDRGDEVYVYTFTGSWTADWPHIHFTQFVGNISNSHCHQLDTERLTLAGILLRPDHHIKPES